MKNYDKNICVFFCLILNSIVFNQLSYSQKTTIDSSQYVRVVNGHIELNQKRIRYWGAIGNFPCDSHIKNERSVVRLKELGFNAIRVFRSPAHFWHDSIKMDLMDHFIYSAKKHGLKVWFAGLETQIKADENDVDVFDDPLSKSEWIEGVKKLTWGKSPLCHIWDPRLRRIYQNHKLRVLDHYNPYTKYRYADDPVFMVWELTNEDWWFHRMKRGFFLSEPEYFQKSLFLQWNNYLIQKYESTNNLKEAWIGNLLPNESLENKNILLLPLAGDITDNQASSLGVNMEAGSLSGKFSNDFFNGKRGADVIEFLLKIWIEYKQTEALAVKSMGVSTALCPLVWENGIGWDLQTQYMQQHADAISHDSYFNGAFHTDTLHKRFPWMSMLEELPKTSWNLSPWLEHNRVEGKPFFVYETQIMQPAKYRAEYPMNIVRLASIQDWDIINWHYWGYGIDTSDIEPYNKPLDYARKGHLPQGYHYQFDEVQQSAMTAAAEIFKNFLLDSAKSPTKYIIGKRSLYSWNMNTYGEIGKSFIPTTYKYGMRLLIDPTVENDQVIGPFIQERGVYEACPIIATPQIFHDWQKGYLMFDAPGVAMFTGFQANYKNHISFKNGVEIFNIKILNPEGTPYPVKEDEKYIEFALVSCDGKPLEQSNEIYLSLVSTSFNSGFTIDEKVHANQPFHRLKEWNWNINLLNSGKNPVLITRVGATVKASFLKNKKYIFYDWHMKILEEGISQNGEINIFANQPVFIIKIIN